MAVCMNDSRELLRQYFGYDNFLTGQEEVIGRILSGEDLLVVMPTGSGKSLCYQLPALQMSGIVLVVSPLIALMKDQVDQLESYGIKSTFINSSITSAEISLRLDEIMAGKYKLVYIAPERFYSKVFINRLKAIKIDLFVVDEAHCISEWGHDFRPSYLKLKHAATFLNAGSIAAFTATATSEVRANIRDLLELSPENEIVTGFYRSNLLLMIDRIDKEKKRLDKLRRIVSKITGSIIVYAGTRKNVEKITKSLIDDGYDASLYHAGLSDEDRKRNQEDFINGDKRVIVCTNAFGMGINKKDVRAVVHFNMPGSVEAYYQEAGRAGRDGEKSFCILLFGSGDYYLQEFFIQGSYPEPGLISQIYSILDSQGEETVLLTHEQILNQLPKRVNEMAISSAIRILEDNQILERLSDKHHKASIKILKDFDMAFDSIDPRAEMQKNVLSQLIEIYGQELYRGVEFFIDDLAMKCQINRDSFIRGIRNLNEKEIISYSPPFRGRGIRMLERNCDLNQLPINYDVLKERSDKEYQRLYKIKGYSYGQECRHRYILEYFGDHSTVKTKCGSCDFCLKSKQKKDTVDNGSTNAVTKNKDRSGAVERGILMTLSKHSGRFGQKVIVDILRGANNQLIRKWKLNNSVFYGYFKDYSRDGLEMILADLIMNGYIHKQKGLYPVLSLSDSGLNMIENSSADESFKQEVEQTQTLKREKIDARIIQTISLCGFEDKKFILAEAGEGVTKEDVDRVLVKLKKEFMNYLQKKHLKGKE